MIRPLLLVAAPLALAGCISFGAKPPPVLFTLTPATPVAAGARTSEGRALFLDTPAVPEKLATLRVPVQATDTTLAYVKDAQWVAAPGGLFRDLLAETVTARAGRYVLPARQFPTAPTATLGGTLVDFGLDARTMEAVVTFDAISAQGDGTNPAARRFTARVPVASAEAGPVAVALNQAANQVAAEIADWVGR